MSFVARSRWLVGSSSTRKLGGSSSMRASTSRVFSPPDSDADLLVDLVARELERAEQVAQHAGRLVREVLLDLLPDGQVRVQHVERLLREVAHACRLAPSFTAPASGASAPATIFRSVVLPEPFRPMTDQRSPRRIVRSRPSCTTRAAVRLRDALEDRHLIARARRLAEIELDDAPLLRQLDPSRSSRAP